MMTRLLILVAISCLLLLPAQANSTVDVVFPSPAEFPDTKTGFSVLAQLVTTTLTALTSSLMYRHGVTVLGARGKNSSL